MVAARVEVGHGRCHGPLETSWVRLKQPQSQPPHQGGEETEGQGAVDGGKKVLDCCHLHQCVDAPR